MYGVCGFPEPKKAYENNVFAQKNGGGAPTSFWGGVIPPWRVQLDPMTQSLTIQFGWVVCGPRLPCAHPQTVRVRYAGPHSPPAKLDSDKFDNLTVDQTGWLKIESCTQGVGAPPQTLGRLCR